MSASMMKWIDPHMLETTIDICSNDFLTFLHIPMQSCHKVFANVALKPLFDTGYSPTPHNTDRSPQTLTSDRAVTSTTCRAVFLDVLFPILGILCDALLLFFLLFFLRGSGKVPQKTACAF